MRASSKVVGRAALVGIATSLTAFALMQGCNDDETTLAPRPDSGTPDTGTAKDSGTTDTGTDGDAGPIGPQPVSFPLSATGHDRLFDVKVDANENAFAVGVVPNGDGSADFSPAVAKFLPSGQLDTTFGGSGTGVATVDVVVGEGGTFRGIGLQSDGKIVIAGTIRSGALGDRDIAVIRFHANGTLDTTFGAQGIRTLNLSQGLPGGDAGLITVARDEQWGLNVLSDDKLIITGAQRRTGVGLDAGDTDFAVVRLEKNGANDATFGSGGLFTYDRGDNKNANPRRAAVLPDGKSVIVSGYIPEATGQASPILFKLRDNGTLDDGGFGPTGVFNENGILGAVTEIYDVAIQGTSFVTAGYGRDTDQSAATDWVSLRIKADGTRDMAYGNGGVLRVDLNGNADNARALTVLPDNRIVIVGQGRPSGTNSEAVVGMFSAGGQPDTTFGSAGRRTYELGGGNDVFWGIARSANRLTIVGYGQQGGDAGNDNASVLFLPLPLAP